MSRALLLLVVLGVAYVLSSALAALDPNQQPIPTYFGSALGSPAAPVLLEMHGDPLCPDCRDDWVQVVSQVVNAFAPKGQLRFVYHSTPLPYHTHAFAASRSAFVCEALKKGSFHDYIDYIYSVQDSFSNNATAAMNAAQIVDAFATAATHIGIDENDFLTEFNNNPQHDMDARAQWKLGVSRGVSGTPMYFVNGVRVLSGNWGVQDWTDLINSLLQ